MATRNIGETAGWTLRRVPRRVGTGARGRRGAGPPVDDGAVPAEYLQADGVRVEEALEVRPTDQARRGGGPPELALEVDVKAGEAALLAIRHPSGALTFNRSVARTARAAGRRTTGPGVARFRVPVRRVADGSAPPAGESARRGVLSNALKIVVIKIAKPAVDKAVSIALPRLAAMWEARVWAGKNLREGWFRVAPAGGAAGGLQLAPALPEPGQRSLLLVHGTFSNAAAAFGDLSRTDFFDRVRPTYGSRIYAYNHFSISRSPDENAELLLSELPAGAPFEFDAITHSRGGLVLRSVVERRGQHGALADRFRLRRAVLVASPNDGTPLATPARWEDTVGWFANLMEVFPDNPFTSGAEFVSESLVWLASHLAGDLPGLRAMDGAGPLVGDLQSPPGPPADAYSALVSNVHPDDGLWQRAVDVGVDSFFASANDLVVPSEGGWRVDRDGTPYVPAGRIGCFGPGGNLDPGATPVNHVKFFDRSETADFLARALDGQTQPLPAIDLQAPLPD
nr:CHAT domain-containing protein [Acidobacteriota bacterium]